MKIRFETSALLVFALLIISCGTTVEKPHATAPSRQADSLITGLTAPFVNGISDQNRGDKTGPMKLTIMFENTRPIGKLVLYESEGKFQYPVDSADIQNGLCQFREQPIGRGVYKIELKTEDTTKQKKANICPIILNPDEPIVAIGFKSQQLEGSLFSSNSKENEGWAAYYLQELIMGKRINEQKKLRAKSDKKEEYNALIAEEENQLQAIRTSTIEQFPGTFLAKLLTWKQTPTPLDKNTYWNNVDFDDPSLIRTNVLHQRGQNFFQLYGNSDETELMNCIDIVVEKAKINDAVLESTLYSMLEGFSQTKYENVCQYILDNYIYGEGCGAPMSEAIKTRSQGIRNVQIGNSPPNIQLPLFGGGQSDLYKMCTQNRYTLVLFWSSWCVRCQEESAEVKQLYHDFGSKGFEILGVSVDTDKDFWKKAIEERGLKFPNVRCLDQWNSKTSKDYFVVKTPIMVLLDQNKTIVAKSSSSILDIRSFLEANLR